MKFHKHKWVPALDQGDFLTMFDFFYEKNPNEVLPFYLCIEYYAEFIDEKSPDP